MSAAGRTVTHHEHGRMFNFRFPCGRWVHPHVVSVVPELREKTRRLSICPSSIERAPRRRSLYPVRPVVVRFLVYVLLLPLKFIPPALEILFIVVVRWRFPPNVGFPWIVLVDAIINPVDNLCVSTMLDRSPCGSDVFCPPHSLVKVCAFVGAHEPYVRSKEQSRPNMADVSIVRTTSELPYNLLGRLEHLLHLVVLGC